MFIDTSISYYLNVIAVGSAESKPLQGTPYQQVWVGVGTRGV